MYNSGSMGTGHSRTVSGLPTSGTIYVRWWALIGSSWYKTDQTYTMSVGSGGGSGTFPPPISSPAPGSKLTSTSVTFTGGHSSQDSQHWLYVGTSLGANNLHDSGSMGTGHSRTVSGLSTSGTIYVRWWSLSGSSWYKTDQTYTMSVGSGGGGSGTFPPPISSPAPGSKLTSTSVTFTGSHSSQDSEHWLYVGTSVGGNNLHDSGSMGTGHSRTVSGLPTSGTIYVRWWSLSGSSWSKTDQTYTMSVGSSSSSSSGSSSSSSGTAYYVATNGNDANPGTQSAPFRTINHGMKLLKAGSTLYVRGGTYYESLDTSEGTKFPPGSSWSTPVKVTAYNGEHVQLKGRINISLPTQYMIFDGLNLDAAGQAHGIALNGGAHHMRFQNLEIKYPNINGIELSPYNGGAFYNEFINLDIHHVAQSLSGHGIYITTSYNLVEGCTLHDNYRYGLHIYDGAYQSSNFNIARNNTIYNNGRDQHTGGMTVGGDGNRITNNLVYGNYRGIDIGPGNARNTVASENTVRDNSWAGFKLTGTNDTVKNNIAYGNNPDYDSSGATGLTLLK